METPEYTLDGEAAALAGADDEPEATAEDDKPVANSIEEALASEAEAPEGKKHKKAKGNKRKDNGAEPTSGWSQPPSQPPPAE